MGIDMVFARRLAALRIAAVAAMAASAALVADGLHPERAFCPLERACDAAAASALGSILGMPTSMLGVLAFGGLYLLTLLPVEWSRRPLQVAGLLATLAGAGFILYQARVLQTFCPLCLVADVAGVAAGLLTLTWPAPPIRASGRRIRGERNLSRVAWTLAGALAVAVPLTWPRPETPAWVEVPEGALLAIEDETEAPHTDGRIQLELVTQAPQLEPSLASVGDPQAADPAVQPGEGVREVRQHEAAAAPPRPAVRRETLPKAADDAIVTITRWLPKARPAATPRSARRAVANPTVDRDPHTTTSAPRDAATPARSSPRPAAKHAAHTAVPEAKAVKPRPPQGPVVVEYLNAYCGHCRATHRRLDKVLTQMGGAVRCKRVYAWADRGYPLWVRACGYAREQGGDVEERLFDELLKARDQGRAEVFAAARRAGLDLVGLRAALQASEVPASLVRERQRMLRAGLRGLPTLDVGRRRLMGEQSETELRAALRVAVASSAAR